MMHKVINKAEYIENWKDFRDCVCFILLDAAIALGILALMLIVVVPVSIMCTLGYSPDVTEGSDDKD
jgi:hypothetical protein